jgi:hypothetical protein
MLFDPGVTNLMQLDIKVHRDSGNELSLSSSLVYSPVLFMSCVLCEIQLFIQSLFILPY